MNLTFTALDVETTGLSPEKDKLIEIGAVKYQNGKVVDTFSVLINPGIPIPEKITSLTGITGEMLKEAVKEKEAILNFLAFVDTDVIVGHNVGFDFSFLKTAAVRHGETFEKEAIDTLKLARRFHADLSSKNLESMCAHYQIVNERSHRAYHDAQASAGILFKMAEQFEEKDAKAFEPELLFYKPKKQEPITAKQRKYLMDLRTYHRIEDEIDMDTMTKSDASRMIDKIILENGMIKR